jgi:transcriptional regulator with XRE-family HTH domain
MVVPRIGPVTETAEVQRAWGEVIRLERLGRRLSQAEVAKLAKTDQKFISNVELGRTTLDSTVRIAAALGLTVADLTARVEEAAS